MEHFYKLRELAENLWSKEDLRLEALSEELLQKVSEKSEKPEKKEIDPLLEELVQANRELKNIEEKLKEILKDDSGEVLAKKIKELQARVDKFRKIKPVCLESDAELKFDIFVKRIINPHLDYANNIKRVLEKIISEASKDLTYVKKEIKEVKLFAELLSKFDEEFLQQPLSELNNTILRIQSILNAKNEKLKKLNESQYKLWSIIDELRKLKETIHKPEKREKTIIRRLPGAKPDELRIKEERITVYVCALCGKEIRRE